MRRFGLLPALLAVFLVALLPLAAWTQPPAAQPAEKLPEIPKPDLSKAELCLVLSAADGDTVTVLRKGRMEKVRLLGVDAPETQDPRKEVQFFGTEAAALLTNLIKGEQVYLVQERAGQKDKYDRTLAHLYRAPDGLWVNLEIVRQGYGQVYSGEAFQDTDLFLIYQRQARETERGLWNSAKKAEWDRQHSDPPAEVKPVPVPVPLVTKPADKPAEVKPEEAKVTVYVTRTGTKYHRAGCSYLSKSSIPMDLKEAKQRYSACSKCAPQN